MMCFWLLLAYQSPSLFFSSRYHLGGETGPVILQNILLPEFVWLRSCGAILLLPLSSVFPENQKLVLKTWQTQVKHHKRCCMLPISLMMLRLTIRVVTFFPLWIKVMLLCENVQFSKWFLYQLTILTRVNNSFRGSRMKIF